MAYDPADLKLPWWLLRLFDRLVAIRLPLPGGWSIGPTRAGALFTGAWCGVWAAALYSGNNLLYLCAALFTVIGGRALIQAVGQLRLALALCTGRKRAPESLATSSASTTVTAGQTRCWQQRTGHRRRDAGWIELCGDYGAGVREAIDCRLLPGEAELRGRIRAARRGLYRLRRWQAATEAPAGLFRIARTLPARMRHELVVLPAALPWQADATAATGAGSSGGEEEFHGLRPYLPGDPITRIHWRKAARSGRWASKQFSAVSTAPRPGARLRVDLRLPPERDPGAFEALLGRARYWMESTPGAEAIILGQQRFPLGTAGERQAALRALAAARPENQPPLPGSGPLLSLAG